MDVLKLHYPDTSDVFVSFPDEWEYIDVVNHEGTPIYLAGFPIERSSNSRDHFHGLGPEINVNLVFYRLYKFFQPWPMPQLTVAWNAQVERGRATDVRGHKLPLQPIGQAQAWFGLTHAVLWECYFAESRQFANWREPLTEMWQRVEQDLDVPHYFTAPHEPTFLRGYREFLGKLGYAADEQYPVWWSKERTEATRRLKTLPPTR